MKICLCESLLDTHSDQRQGHLDYEVFSGLHAVTPSDNVIVRQSCG